MGLNTLIFGGRVVKLREVDSTSRYLRSLLEAQEAPEGLVVWAENQTEGRGQRGSVWLSDPGSNLTLSIVLRPNFLDAAAQFSLNKAVALGVAEFVIGALKLSARGLNLEVNIKWPNDILVDERKIAGILIENILDGTRIKSSIVGIGININQEKFDDALPNPVSLKALTGTEFPLNECLENLLASLEKYYLLVRNQGFGVIDEHYHRLLFRKGKWSSFALQGKPVQAMITGVNSQGYLQLRSKENHAGKEEELWEIKELKALKYL